MEFDPNFKPVVRRSHSASLTKEGSLIVGVVPEQSVEIEINEEWISSLICLLDGKKTIAEITDLLNKKEYYVELEEIVEVIQYLYESGVIEDAQEYQRSLERSKISTYDANRYDRQILLFQAQVGSYELAFEAQKKIKNTKIALIGLGGIGSYAFYKLSAMGFGLVRAVDFDKVELTNLSRQILYSEKDVGRLKIDVAREKSQSINSNVNYEFINLQVSNVDDAIKTFENVDFAIVAADIPRGKIWKIFSEASFRTGTPTLFLGSAQTWVCCGPLIIPGLTPCYDCSCPELVSADHPVVDFIRERYTTTLIDPYNAIGASLGVLETVKYITNFQECRVIGKRLLMDLGSYETFLVAGETKEGCPICEIARQTIPK